MDRKNESFPLTDVQWAYILGRKEEFMAGDVATHYYNEIVNNIDLERFERALNQVIDRHPMLHTIAEEDGTQYELEEYEYYKIKQYDLTAQTEEEQAAFLAAQRERLSHYKYQAGTWPMFTFEAVILDERHKQLFVSIDLVIADAGSILILFNELYEYYTNPDLVKPAPPITFQQFVESVEESKSTEKYRADRGYWAGQIPNLAKGPELPEKMGGTGEENKFRRLMRIFEPEEWLKCKGIFTKRGMIPTTFLCECYREVLSYWSGNSSFSINLTTSNRGRLPGTEQVIGDFTSLTILSMPDEFEKGDFWGNARNLQRKFMEVYSHSSYDGVSVERDYVKYHNLQNELPFPIVFTSMMGGGKEVFTKDFFGESVYSLSQTPQVYLDCQVSEEADVLIVSWDYPGNQFDARMMEEMFEQFVTLILEAGGEDGRTDHILKASDADTRVMEHYNQTDADNPAASLREIITNAFQQFGPRIALMDGTEHYTYAETEKRANGYACYLREQGIQAGDCVAVKGVKSAETIFQILGCVKAGAVFVPVHPEYPAERVNYMLTDSRAKLYLDASVAPGQGACDDLPQDDLDSDAYIIYTSGSTGQPKGVIISHREVSNTLCDMNRRFGVTADDRVLNISDFGFDLSIYDIFGSMLAGASIVVGKDIRDIGQICQEVAEKEVTVWNSVPSILTLALDYLGNERVPSVTKVFLSGDWIPLNTHEKMQRVFPNAELISLGGATEGSIWSIYYPVTGVKPGWKSIPYGFPLANQQCYVMDVDRSLCPIGVRGEIYIGGAGVATGYTDEEQTKSSFFEHEKYGRIYKAGDMGVFEREGYISILGRIDQQVKIHGHRIECMEIEKEIERYNKVSRAFVEVVQSKRGRRLLAYIVPNKEEIHGGHGASGWLKAGEAAGEEMPKEFFEGESSEADILLELVSLENIKRVVKELCDDSGVTGKVTVREFCMRCKLKEVYKKLIQKWFYALEKEGLIQRDGNRYDLSGLAAEDIGSIRDKLSYLESSVRTDYERENLRFFSLCMLNAKQVLLGDQAVTELLFPEGEWETAKSLYNANPRAEFNNHIIAAVVQSFVEERQGKEEVSIFEIGAGIGGTTELVLERLSNDMEITYTYTDLSKFFTRQARQKFKDYQFMDYGLYNLDHEPQCQGYPLESYDIIIAANVMHDATHVDQSLCHVHNLLKPEGILILLEVTKELYTLMTTVELLEGFSSYEDFRVEKRSPLMCPEEWKALLADTGFQQVHVLPKEEIDLGENVIIGQKSAKSRFLTTELDVLIAHLGKTLPQYMVPYRFIQLDHMPFGNNGKINRKKLPQLEEESLVCQEDQKPETSAQKAIYHIWVDVLGYGEFGIEQEFFEAGGDSLLMIRCIAGIERQLNHHIDSQTFLENATIEKLASFVEKA